MGAQVTFSVTLVSDREEDTQGNAPSARDLESWLTDRIPDGWAIDGIVGAAVWRWSEAGRLERERERQRLVREQADARAEAAAKAGTFYLDEFSRERRQQLGLPASWQKPRKKQQYRKRPLIDWDELEHPRKMTLARVKEWHPAHKSTERKASLRRLLRKPGCHAAVPISAWPPPMKDIPFVPCSLRVQPGERFCVKHGGKAAPPYQAHPLDEAGKIRMQIKSAQTRIARAPAEIAALEAQLEQLG